MNERPTLTTQLNAQTFRQYYYLKEELVDFCRKNDLQTTGSKSELSERIAIFLESGKRTRSDRKTRKSQAEGRTTSGEIKTDSIIEENFVCSEKHRAFFKDQIGKSFSFNVAFQKWLKSNAGKTYADAITAYHQILKEKKTNGKGEIEKQFEYNTYIRDFFAANKGKTLEQAIKCWKFKKSQKGHNKYEDSDLAALDGVGELVSELRTAQGTFNKANDEYTKASVNKGESATSVKKSLISALNDKFVPYLSAVAPLADYKDFASKCEAEIAKANATVSSRNKTAKSE